MEVQDGEALGAVFFAVAASRAQAGLVAFMLVNETRTLLSSLWHFPAE